MVDPPTVAGNLSPHPCDCYRPLLPLTFALALGIAGRAVNAGFDIWCLTLIIGAAIGTACQIGAHRRGRLAPLLLFGALGYVALAPWLPSHYPQHHIIHLTDGRSYLLAGTVDEPPWMTPDQRLKLVVRIERRLNANDDLAADGRVRLTVFGEAPTIQAGDRVVFRSRLRPIRNFRNPGGFDYKRHMAFKQISATAWTRGTDLRVRANRKSPAGWLHRTREDSRQLITAALSGDARAVMAALTIGDRQAISPRLRDVFNRLGIGHLLAISGLHVGIIALVLMAILRRGFNRLDIFLQSGGGQAAAGFVTIPAILAYGLLAGMAPSTQRAVIMVVFGLIAYLLKRDGDTLNLLALAGFLILVWHPPMLFAVGFQMSFAAVLAIVMGLQHVWPGDRQVPASRHRDVVHRLGMFMAVTVYATVGTLPLLMHYFQQFSMIGLLANLVAVPAIGFGVLPLGLASIGLMPFSPAAASAGLQLAGIVLEILMTAARWVASFDYVALRTFQPTGLEIILYYVLLGVLMAIRVYPRAKWVLAAALVCMVMDAGWWYHYRFNHRDLRVTVLDVGQGSATLLEFPGGQTMLVDGGGYASNQAFDMGHRVIAPFLLRRKIMTVDYLILSHPSSDHMNGLLFVIQHFNPRTLIWNHDRTDSDSAQRFRSLINHLPLSVPRYQDLPRTLTIGGARLHFLNPPSDFKVRREPWRDLNNNSIALQLVFAGHSILLPGDIERPAEMEILRRVGAGIKSTVMLVPHHGSRTSSSPAFVAAVRPTYAIISCGWRNRFGLPHPEILSRYRRLGSRILRTDNHGAVQIRLRPGRVQVDGLAR
jgi:competence protein ComEC